MTRKEREDESDIFFQQENNSWDVITHNTLSYQSGYVCSINYENIDETN